jgi:hypothetical protein
MLTLFTTAKPFREHSGIIQRNALKSWTMLHPRVEVILFGDEEGAEEVARELALRHEPIVRRNSFGTKQLNFMFERAQDIAQNDLLCYANCDIILFPEFCSALERTLRLHATFLMVGRRWDTNISRSFDFTPAGAPEQLRQFARAHGVQRGPDAVDYFAFTRGLYHDIPPLVVGRIWWDHWLVWKARRERAEVIDASESVAAIHQNHAYGYHPAGEKGVWTDEQARRNFELAGGCWHLYTIDDATHILTAEGERSNPKRFWAPYWRWLRPKCIPVWFAILDFTRPLRKVLGLHTTRPASSQARVR